jgi:hypothetical protein
MLQRKHHSSGAACFKAFAVACLLAAASPSDAPAADTMPKRHFGTYGEWRLSPQCILSSRERLLTWTRCQRHKVFSGLVVAPARNKKIKVFYTTFSGGVNRYGGKVCEFEGIGDWTGRTIVARQNMPSVDSCVVTVQFGAGGPRLDSDGTCSGCWGWLKDVGGLSKLSNATAVPPRYKPPR